MSREAVIFNVQRFSTEDGPGIRTTCFLKGCPLSCVWCHNPEGISPRPQTMWYDVRCIGCRSCVDVCPVGALTAGDKGIKINRSTCSACGKCADACPAAAIEIIGKSWTPEALTDEVLRDSAFYETSGGGVTISGGEPLAQHEFVMDFISRCKGAGLHVALDTSGYAAPAVFDPAADAADMVLLDLKTMNPAAHLELTGVPLEPVLRSARSLGETRKRVWIRTPVIPGATDSDENITAVARFIADNIPGCDRYDILPFSNICASKYERLGMEFRFKETPLVPMERMEELKADAERAGAPNVVIQGLTTRKPQ
ncbi:MAG TPA: glycyl-radical enzyme activating protein [bacterium]|nr:MAG: Benzylsuccinate synthase activating enzyme [bacterium ADurb.Bin236]HPI77460.1 glycyl-radical enzyme activating protein [bacterium]HPN95303.1 glycyl-radical enzyme activating protein [bacterium]